MSVAIYALLCPETLRIRYVGKAKNPHKRLLAHLQRAKDGRAHKNVWIRSVLVRNLVPKIEILEWVPSSEWEEIEQEYIRVFRAIGFDLTNTLPGGEGRASGCKISDETKAAMRLAQLGRKHPESVKEKISLSHNRDSTVC